MLGLERERLGEVGVEIGGALAGDAVDEIERDVVESGITERVHGPPDVVRRRLPLEHLEQVRLEALRAERDAGDAARAQELRELGRHRLRVRLDRHLLGGGKRARAALELARSVNVGVPPPRKTVSTPSARTPSLELELGEERVDVGAVLPAPPDHGDEVAVPAPVRAEREVDVEVPDVAHRYRFRSESRLRTARKASCGTSTPPTCFIRFLPFFCFSSSLRLRVMSPP